jgi:hypothetical protein
MRLWSQQFAFILFIGFLLLVSVAPVLAQDQNNYVEDGVKLIKVGNYPAKLDRVFYGIVPEATVAIDGNQYYWVQIGKDVARGLLHEWWGYYLGLGLAVILAVVVVICGYYLLRWVGPAWLQKPMGRLTNGLFILFFIGMYLIQALTPIMVDLGDRHTHQEFGQLQDADGCILLKVNKASVGSDPMLLKSGVNVTALKHINGTLNLPLQRGVRTV